MTSFDLRQLLFGNGICSEFVPNDKKAINRGIFSVLALRKIPWHDWVNWEGAPDEDPLETEGENKDGTDTFDFVGGCQAP